MFKKIILSILCVFALAANLMTNAHADELTDVQSFFNNYVNAANSYADNLPTYYIPNAKIIRVVYKPDGTKQPVVIPFDRYLSELRKSATIAKTVHYKNNYTNRSYIKAGSDYKISTIRIPRNDKSGLPAYFIVTKTPQGWKIKEESMGTTVQKFLNAK